MRRRTRATGRAEDPGPTSEVSPSEQELFGGPLVYDTSWARYEQARYQLGLRVMIAKLPGLVATAAVLAWRADRRATLTVAAAELGRGITQAVGLLGVNWLLATLLTEGEITERMREALPVALFLACAAAAGALCQAASVRATGPLEPKVERLARERYLERAYRVEMAAIEDERFHRLLESAQYGAVSARRMIGHTVSVISALVSLLAAAAVLTVLHWALLPMLLVMVLPSAWATLHVARRRYRSFHRWVQHSRACTRLAELMSDPQAAPEVRVHDVGPYILRHFRSMSFSQESEQERLARLAARTGLLAAACTGAATLATYSLLGWLLWSGAMALAAAGTAVLAIRTGAGNLGGLVRQINYLHEESLHVGDLNRLMEESADRQIPLTGAPLGADVTEIQVEGVTFTYPGTDNSPALRDLSLTIPTTGGVVALVGENGSGKTTLVKLLCGLYLPQHGTVRFDGLDAAETDRQDIFSRFAIVHQDHYRWPMTARVNATISRTDAPVDDDRLRRAALRAGVREVVAGLPRGWDTLLTRTFQGGHALSGGQWQRMGIARAHYRQAGILIVDEPTAALDARAEQGVFDEIRALADEGQTVILITHRMASVRRADLVHVLHEGRLAETGTPEELLARPGGRFAELYAIQQAQFARPNGKAPGARGAHVPAREGRPGSGGTG